MLVYIFVVDYRGY